MHKVNVLNVQNVRRSRNAKSIVFEDGINEYSFSLSKSTLYKRFVVGVAEHEFEVPILKDPLSELKALLNDSSLFSNNNIIR